MYHQRLICVSTLGISEGRCKYCGDRLVWANTASEKGKPSRTLPFTWPRPWPIRAEVNGETGIGFEWWATEKLHFVTCTAKPTRRSSRPGSRLHA